MRNRTALAIAGVISATFSISAANAAGFTYSDFSSTAGLTFVGSATTTTTSDGVVARLTPAIGNQSGAFYSTTAFTLGSNATFSTEFQFRFTNGSSPPADGITFVLAANPTGLGAAGGGLGYQGVPNSVAIEFDTWNNGEVGTDNHVGVDTNGLLNDISATTPYGVQGCTPAANGCMSNGHLWTADITYDGSHLNVSVRDPAEGSASNVISNLAIDIAALLGTNNAFVGFTGGTGAAWENQDIVNWQFANTSTLPSTVPLPGALPLFATGLGALGLLGWRRKKKLAA